MIAPLVFWSYALTNSKSAWIVAQGMPLDIGVLIVTILKGR